MKKSILKLVLFVAMINLLYSCTDSTTEFEELKKEEIESNTNATASKALGDKDEEPERD